VATDTLSRTLSALADPTRRAILERLADGESSVGALAEPFEISRPAISKHLCVLEQAGLVTRLRDGRVTRWEALLAPWSEQRRAFRVAGFNERIPAKGQIARVSRNHRDLARWAGIEEKGGRRPG